MDEQSLLNRERNSLTMGTWSSVTFQLSLKEEREDPLSVQIFSGLGLLCIPLIGVYGNDYTPCGPLVVIEMPAYEHILRRQLPEKLLEYLFKDNEPCEIQFFIEIHSAPPPNACQKFTCDNRNEANMMYHTWLYKDILFDMDFNAVNFIEMGIFSPIGVNPVHQDLKDAGIAFERLEERSIAIHSCCFSPENAQFQMRNDVDFCSFFALATEKVDGLNRKVVTFHMIPRYSDQEQMLTDVINNSLTLRDLLQGLSILYPKGHDYIRQMIGKINN